jgi:hypothetical protein
MPVSDNYCIYNIKRSYLKCNSTIEAVDKGVVQLNQHRLICRSYRSLKLLHSSLIFLSFYFRLFFLQVANRLYLNQTQPVNPVLSNIYISIFCCTNSEINSRIGSVNKNMYEICTYSCTYVHENEINIDKNIKMNMSININMNMNMTLT